MGQAPAWRGNLSSRLVGQASSCEHEEADQGVGRGRGRPPHYLCRCPEAGRPSGIGQECLRHKRGVMAALFLFILASTTFAQTPVKITLDQAIDMALKHNHTLQAARTQIQQNQAAEMTANLRPNPTFFTDWEYLPIFTRQQGTSVVDYLQASTEADLGLSYLIERGKKRARRLQAAKDTTAVTRAQVARYRARSRVSGGFSLHQRPARGIYPRTRADGFEELSANRRHQRNPI